MKILLNINAFQVLFIISIITGISSNLHAQEDKSHFSKVLEFPEEMINDGEYFPANYDKPHSMNLLANLKASRRLIISTSIIYSTGRACCRVSCEYYSVKCGNK